MSWKEWSARCREMVKTWFRRIFPLPVVLQQFDQRLEEVNKRADALISRLDGETKWFLNCTDKGGEVTCQGAVGDTDEES